MSSDETRDQRVLVIGLDGATFDLLLPWMQEGRLPHLAAIRGQSAHGYLRSTIPPVTAPAWASFQTGKNPGKHGLFHFTAYQQGTYETRIVDASSVRSKTIWQILSDHRKRVGIINVPLTYPPVPVNGFMISGMLTPQTAKAFYPPELYEELRCEIGNYQIFTPGQAFDYLGVKRFVDRVAHLAEKRMQAALFLLSKEKWDFFMVHFQSTDILQHALWGWMDPTHPDFTAKSDEDKSYVMGFYRDLDHMIGRLQQHVGDETGFIIMSDHGFGPANRRVYINHWLTEQGLLATSGGSSRRRVIQFAESVVRKGDVLKIRRRLIKSRSRTEGLVDLLTRDMLIDWSRTKAFALAGPFFGRIYLNCRGREAKGIVDLGEEREELQDAIAAKLLQLRDPITGQTMIKNVFKREDIYFGPLLETLPDLVVEPTDGYMVMTRFRGDTLVEPVPRFMTGTHRMNGMLMLKGKPFIEDTQVENADITDLAPTILYVLGVPIPTDMDGKVLIEAVKSSYVQEYPVRYEDSVTFADRENQEVYSPQDMEDIRERLAGLGYLS